MLVFDFYLPPITPNLPLSWRFSIKRFTRLCHCIEQREISGAYQGHSQKFVLGGIKVFGGIKLLNSCSDIIFTQ